MPPPAFPMLQWIGRSRPSRTRCRHCHHLHDAQKRDSRPVLRGRQPGKNAVRRRLRFRRPDLTSAGNGGERLSVVLDDQGRHRNGHPPARRRGPNRPPGTCRRICPPHRAHPETDSPRCRTCCPIPRGWVIRCPSAGYTRRTTRHRIGGPAPPADGPPPGLPLSGGRRSAVLQHRVPGPGPGHRGGHREPFEDYLQRAVLRATGHAAAAAFAITTGTGHRPHQGAPVVDPMLRRLLPDRGRRPRRGPYLALNPFRRWTGLRRTDRQCPRCRPVSAAAPERRRAGRHARPARADRPPDA